MFALLLLFLPSAIAVFSLLFVGKFSRWIVLCGSLVQLFITFYAMNWGYNSLPSNLFTFRTTWIPSVGIDFNLNIDGVSLILILLTNFLIPIIVLSSFKNRAYSNNNIFYALILFMQTALIGVFSAADGFLFYVFWEAALIPVYFIAAIWGGVNKIQITFKFFIYTIAGSLLMLMGFIYLYLQTPFPHSFDINVLTSVELSGNEEFWVFFSLFIAFAIKMPIFPLHTWQPNTYAESPTPATMLLSGIMLKMGIFGVIRWLIPIAPFTLADYSYFIVLLSVIGVVYGSIIAIQQKDFKRLVAFSSIAHVGLISAGLFSGTTEGVQGAILQMFNHGINVVGIFYVLEIIAQRTGTRQISELGGIVHTAPKLAICFVIITMGSVALPLTNGFAGEFLLILGIYKFNMILAVIAGFTIILGAVYMLRMYKNVMLGESNSLTKNFKDLSARELFVLIPICAVIILIGFFPNLILNISNPIAKELVNYLQENSINYLSIKTH
jgi:NADH-quinone oxidoreductase subunit M